MPTVFCFRGFRVCFFSAEESRMHVHAKGHGARVKIWLEPEVELASCQGKMGAHELNELLREVEARKDECVGKWREYHG